MTRSIADCPGCRRIPQKLIASSTGYGSPAVPPEVGELVTVVEAASCRLLRCPTCATPYYYAWDRQDRDTCTMASTP